MTIKGQREEMVGTETIIFVWKGSFQLGVQTYFDYRKEV